MPDHVNLQAHRTGKIYGIVKMGANRTDMKAIKFYAGQGLDEHEIQQKTGVHFKCIRSFMKSWNVSFTPSEVPPNPDTQHLHDRIAELENNSAGTISDSSKLAVKNAKLEKEIADLRASKVDVESIVEEY